MARFKKKQPSLKVQCVRKRKLPVSALVVAADGDYSRYFLTQFRDSRVPVYLNHGISLIVTKWSVFLIRNQKQVNWNDLTVFQQEDCLRVIYTFAESAKQKQA